MVWDEVLILMLRYVPREQGQDTQPQRSEIEIMDIGIEAHDM